MSLLIILANQGEEAARGISEFLSNDKLYLGRYGHPSRRHHHDGRLIIYTNTLTDEDRNYLILRYDASFYEVYTARPSQGYSGAYYVEIIDGRNFWLWTLTDFLNKR